jgi:transposase
MVLHLTRDLLIRQRTRMLNSLRSHLAEFGIVAAKGPRHVMDLVRDLRAGEYADLPEVARSALLGFSNQHEALSNEIRALDRQLMAWHRADAASRRLATIPGVGFITATAMAASVPDPGAFASGRQFAAFLGLVPRQNSSGGKDRLGRISKMGDGYLRRLLVNGATSVIRYAATDASATGHWIRGLLARKPVRVVTVAIANKTARIIWAVLSRGDVYRRPATP